MTRRDRYLPLRRAVGRELRRRPLARRRLLSELVQHIDDSVAELEASGISSDEAIEEALRRLGDVDTIAAAVRATRSSRRSHRWAQRLRSPAWVAVAAMSLVTAWAAELPQASGAKATASPSLTKRVASRRNVREHVAARRSIQARRALR